jgi:hypothetical protein
MHPAVTQTAVVVFEYGESREDSFRPIKNMLTLKAL